MEKIHIYMFSYEQLNYKDYITNVLLVNTVVFPIKRIQSVISSYLLVVKLLQYHLKQEQFTDSYRPASYLPKVYLKNTLIILNLPNCEYKQACNICY